MTDLEGIANKLIDRGHSDLDITDMLVRCYDIFKPDLHDGARRELAKHVLDEVKKSRSKPTSALVDEVLTLDAVGLTIGEQGVGCRGMGDFVAHEYVTRIASGPVQSFLSPASMDDAGAVVVEAQAGQVFVVSKMEGMHSRLSNFPFIAGFHVTRACLRDLLVKGAVPISLMVDIHLGDDADAIKLFDFMAGVAAVSELARVPITAGSTLRIGGDMVIGDRITGGIAGIGTCSQVLARKDIRLPCDIIMTEGAGGGTVATTAIYNGQPDVLLHTLNVKFIKAMNALLDAPAILEDVYCCSDVTNGGLRGDLFEILKESGLGATVSEPDVAGLVHPDVKRLLDETSTDFLGVSLDALLVFCKPTVTSDIIEVMSMNGISSCRIGTCNPHGNVILVKNDGAPAEMSPRFRESAYTPVKKAIGEHVGSKDQDRMSLLVKEAFDRSVAKKGAIVQFIQQDR